ncbi:Gfo/Idh/MocA family protein [Lacticaseibacillus suihuaensis]
MKVGIIGCAHMHVNSYTSCLDTLGVPITGIYDRDDALAKGVAAAHHAPVLPSAEAVAASDCDTVLICAENAWHLPYVRIAAAAGKAIVVEKPMAISVAECDEIISIVEQAGVKLMVAHPVRFTNTMADLRKLVRDGTVGTVRAINATNHGQNPGGWFIQKALSGGGAVFDHSIHMIDLVNYLFGWELETVTAYAAKSDPALECEDSGIIQATFKGGAILNLDTSWNRPNNYPGWGDATLELIADNGRFVADGFGRQAEFYGQKPVENAWLRFEPSMDLNMWQAYQRVIDDNLPSPVDAHAGRYSVLLAEKAYESIATGRTVRVTH